MPPQRSALKSWAKQTLHGVQNCLIPSFKPDMSELDEAGIRLDVRQSIAHGFVSSLCLAEAGLTLDEARRFVSIVTDEAKDAIVVSTTIMFDTFAQNEAMLRHANDAGCRLAFIDYPHSWTPRNEQDVYDAALSLCNASDMGVFLHPVGRDNMRRLHPSGCSADLLQRLAGIDSVVAVEITDFGLLSDYLHVCADQILLQCPLERFLPLLVERCNLQLLGPGAYELYQTPDQPLLVQCMKLLRSGDHDNAMAIYWRLAPVRMAFEMKMMQMMPTGAHPLPLWKFYQWLSGGNGGYSSTRLPIMEVSEMDKSMALQAMMMSGLRTPAPTDDSFYAGRVNVRR